MAISPIHDKDIRDLENGKVEYKKAHYHVIYIANNPVTADSVRNRINRCMGDDEDDNENKKKFVSHVKIVDSVQNLYLYLTHESSDAKKKNKHVYDSSDIVHLNNFEIGHYIQFSKEENDEYVNDLFDFIIDNKIKNAVELREAVGRGELNRERTYKAMKSAVGFINLAFNGVYQDGKMKTEEYKF